MESYKLKDRDIGNEWIFYIFGLFLLFFIPSIFLRELNALEAYKLLYAEKMLASGTGLFQGGHFDVYPFYPFMVSCVSFFTGSNVFAVRIISALSVFGMALMAGYTAMRRGGHKAGATAAAIVLCSIISMQTGSDASTEYTLFAFLISSAWFLWYRLSRIEKKWTLCWIVCLSLVFLGVLASGLKSIFYFYLPILFLRRPLRCIKRLSQWNHVIIFSLFAFFTVICLYMITGGDLLFFEREYLLHSVSINKASYITSRLLFFPLLLLYLFPWILIMWPPFCAAYKIMEQTPVFFRFLRVIILTIFLFVIIFPSSSIYDLLPLLPLAAVAASLHYSILMRRSYFLLNKIRKFLRVVIWIFPLIPLALFLVQSNSNIKFCPGILILFQIALSLVFLLLLYFLTEKRIIFSLETAFLIGMIYTLTISTFYIINYKKRTHSQEIANVLQTGIV
ncbi:MAG: hypothetical protein U9O87_08470, partial [Verrucomicrobiota bacterium]|nr:hypothetical protein [Verrucomicrobiota bacterium]